MAERLSSEDAKRLRDAIKRKYREKHLSTFPGVSRNGQPYTTFNFGDGLQKKIASQIFEKMQDLGFISTEIVEIWEKDTGIPDKSAKRFLYGIKSGMSVWELEHLCKTFNFSIELKHTGVTRFEHSIERERLIIRCKRHPEFHVNMNTENFLDFELEFKNKYEGIKFPQYRLNKIFKKMMEYYFLTKAKNKKMPFKYQQARIKFESKIIDIREKIDQL